MEPDTNSMDYVPVKAASCVLTRPFGTSPETIAKRDRRRTTMRPSGPWAKRMTDLTKYDWLTAVILHPLSKNNPCLLRIANALMQHADQDTLLAWAGQETLMGYAGFGAQRQVRKAVAALNAIGAIDIIPISQLDEKTRTTVQRHGRGKAYRLKRFWGYEVFEGSLKTPRIEPPHLKQGREWKRTKLVRSNRTAAVRSREDCDGPANPERTLEQTDNNAFERKGSLASTREDNAYAYASGRLG